MRPPLSVKPATLGPAAFAPDYRGVGGSSPPRPSATESKLGNPEEWQSVFEPLEVTAVARIRGTQGIQEDTKGQDELGD